MNLTRKQVLGVSQMALSVHHRRVAAEFLKLLRVVHNGFFETETGHSVKCPSCHVLNVEGSKWEEHKDGCKLAAVLPSPEPPSGSALSEDGIAEAKALGIWEEE